MIRFGKKEVALGISCADVRDQGSGSKFNLEDLRTLQEDDFSQCLVLLGKDPLGPDEGKYIWEYLIQMYQGVPGIPETELRQLGWIAQVIPIRDIANLTLGDIDTIAAFGQYHNLSNSQLEALAGKVRDDWSSKEPSDYTFYDLMALQHLLCGFNRSAIEEIHPDSYKEAANVLSTLRGCSKEALLSLVSLAMSPDAFGSPSTWTSQVKMVGCLLNGLSAEIIASIPAQGMESITPDIVPCLLPETLKDMSSAQLRHFTPSAVGAMSAVQKSVLSSDQQRAVSEAYEGNIKTSVESNAATLQVHLQLFYLSVWLFIGSFYTNIL